ncbi:ferredoxin family protein [Patulibacter sp. NPDC049589]|uniref:4Fe-4S dicluster domain-containing protein n=1 Tax=Patulibacter sp. NPDC049589 TaxID=3154731 RepID=UPI0034470806
MAVYVIAEPCVDTKDQSCVDVCPVDCIHPTRDDPDYGEHTMLYIDPVECIGCDACAIACPVGAVFTADDLPAEWRHYAGLNATFFSARSAA